MTIAAPASALVDVAVRRRVLGELDRTFFVEAGAGTGKTTVLVGRMVNTIAAGGVTMQHLAAITFTEAAAAELRDRVREGLERATVDPARSADERARCTRAVADIDLAAISTIHAFAGHLLRTHPLEAGLPPGFATLDEIEQGFLFERRFKTWFWQTALAEPARTVVQHALLLGLSQDTIRAVAEALEGQLDVLNAGTLWIAPELPAALPVAHTVGARLMELAAWTVYAQDGPDDGLVHTVDGLQLTARRLVQAETETDAVAALVALGWIDTKSGNAWRWRKLPDGRWAGWVTKQALSTAADEVRRLLDAHRSASLAAVLTLLRDFVLAGYHQRRSDGVASFQDLLTWARDLLRDHPDVRHSAQARFQRIFVDEFQDTDPLQAEIAFYLGADESGGQPLPPDWRAIPLTLGKLFLVGDPKQSIYRFRRADITLYDDLLERLGDTREHLVQNFRSVRPIIDWVNQHFGARMRAERGVQPDYVPLAARWDAFDPERPTGVHRIGGQIEGTAADAAQAESAAFANVARAAVEEGWLVTERGPDGERTLRPARFADVCILLPKRTHLRRLERALEAADVPFSVESGKLVLATQEVRDLLSCLRAIEDPSDQVALVAALRSAAYACSDVELLEWVEGEGRLDHEHPGVGPDGPVKAALENLADFHRRRHLLSPPALIEAFIRDRLLVATAFGEARPREAWRRLRYVVSRARTFTSTGRHTLRGFLNWIEGLQRADVRDPEQGSAESDEDAIHIQTVHGAKGLEFPIVLLGGLASNGFGGFDEVEVIADRRSGRIECTAGRGWQTADYLTVKGHEKRMAEAEAVRLLYVAATRARDRLVLSLFRGRKSDGCAADMIEKQLACGEPNACQPLAVRALATRSPDLPEGVFEPPVVTESDEGAWLAARTARVRALTAPVWAVQARIGLPPVADSVFAAEVRQLVRRWWNGEPDEPGMSAPEVVLAARAILASEAVRHARLSGTLLRDVPLLAHVDNVFLDETADLVYRTSEGTTVVLYAVNDSHEDAAQRAGRIAAALRAATGHLPAVVNMVESTGETVRHPRVDQLACLAIAEPQRRG
jgi:ATP-dependent helicase/nuclease subunit A